MNNNNHPLTKRAAEHRLGKNFEDATCSQLCRNCGKPNYFVGQLWDETVPETFNCVTCGHQNGRLYDTPTPRRK